MTKPTPAIQSSICQRLGGGSLVQRVSNLLNHTNQYILNIKLDTQDDIFKLYFPNIKLINLA